MKTSFLKNFFNSKDIGSKNNFNIHSVDLDDSDDVIVCNESFFQRNISQNSKEILKNKFMKNEDNLNDKKINLFSLNDSSNSNCEIKSPIRPNHFNLTKMRQSPLNSPLFDREKSIKNKANLEFIVPTSIINNVLKTPKKDDKMMSFQSYKAKGLNSPSLKFMNINNSSEINKMKNKNCSPPKIKTLMLPSISKIKNYDKDDNINQNKMSSMFFKNDMTDKNPNIIQRNEYNKHEKEMENYEKLNKRNSYKHDNQPQSLDEISGLISESKLVESQCNNENDSTESEDNKLKVLHIKLKLESDKIQKWRDSIEKELLLKTKKILESDKIIESLRSSNLDLQMRQENISLNYREEIECRSEVSKKIENSRQLCNILKEKIADIENLNQNHTKENENMKLAQEQILYVINFVSDDIKYLSTTVAKCLIEFKNKLNSKELEIENLLINLSKEKTFLETETEKYHLEIKRFESQLLLEKENYNNLNNELNQISSEKVDIQEMLSKEKIANKSLLKEQTNLEDQLSNLKILNDEIKENNINASKEISVKENMINILNTDLSELNLDFSKYKSEADNTKLTLENVLKDNEDVILHLRDCISTKENEIKTSNELMELKIGEINVKIALKDTSIDNLTKNIIEKEEKILCLDEVISKLNEDLKETCEKFNNLRLENDAIVKNASILKSSNQDLREELNNSKIEINEQSEEVLLFKREIITLKNNNNSLRDESDNYKKLTNELQDENSSMRFNLDDLKMKMNRFGETNQKLKESYENLKETNIILLDGKDIEIKDLTRKYDTLILVKQKLDKEIENKFNECNTLQHNLSDEQRQNEKLLQTCKDLKHSMTTKECDLSNIIAEKKELNTITANLSSRNELYDSKLKEYESLNSEYKSKISSLEIFIEDLSKDKQNILKSREDLRKELMFTLEQCKNEHDVIEKKRNKEIETLKTQINSLSTNSNNNSKKSKNKIGDLQTQISQQKEEFDNLQREIKNILVEKNLMNKNVENSNLILKELTEKIESKDHLLDEITSEKINLKNLITEFESKMHNLSKDLLNKNIEISKLKEIEMAYEEMKNNIITNSPPMSTQVPDFIKTSGSATPKSQRLSARLNSINDTNLDGQKLVVEKQTPQKTPKGILRQHGSASKRRRVIFEDSDVVEDNDNCDDGSLLSDRVDIDLEIINKNNCKKKLTSLDRSPTNLNSVTTPKKPNLVNKLGLTDSRSVGRLNNIRKTPSKAPSKLNDKHKKDDKNWFDSDNFFGATEP